NPACYAFTDSHSPGSENLGIFASCVSCFGFSGFFINHKNNAGIERYNCPQFVGDQRDSVIQIEGGANSLRNLMKRKYFSLSFRNAPESNIVVNVSSQHTGGQPGVR